MVTRAENCIAELKKKSSSDDDDVDLFYDSIDNLDNTPQQPSTQVLPSQSLPDPVRTLDISFADVDLQHVKEGLTFKRIGSRQVAYAGNSEYRYRTTSHPNILTPQIRP